MESNKVFKLCILASGSGTNAENIIKYFQNNDRIAIELVLTDNPNAGVLERANRLQILSQYINKDCRVSRECFSNKLIGIDFIILAGYMRLIPKFLILQFENRMLNVHPALLPNYGGKGMYGMNVHKAVYNSNDNTTGISIHLVNENYDEGKILLQKSVDIHQLNTAEEIAEAVHKLEYEYYPKVIENYILNYV